MEKVMADWRHLGYEIVEDPSGSGSESPPSRWRTLLFLVLSHITALMVGMGLYRSADMRMLQPSASPSVTPQLGSIVPEALQVFSKTVRTNGTLDFPSVYRGRGPEVDNAWKWLTGVGTLNLDVSAEQLHRMGIDANTVARYADGKYMLSVEAFHQLHCVDLLRKVTFYNYEYYSARPEEDASFRNPDQMETHVDHCLEMMRQNLMCQADPTIMSYHNVAVRRMPWPNFSTVHQCRDFGAIYAWARKLERDQEEDAVQPERPSQILARPP